MSNSKAVIMNYIPKPPIEESINTPTPIPPDEMPQVPSRGNTEGISVGGYPSDSYIISREKGFL